MKNTQKQLLIAALSVAFSEKLTATSIDSNTGVATYAPMAEKDNSTFTIFAGPAVRSAFKPIDGMTANHADITFDVQFNDCTYNAVRAQYEWNGNSNLTFGDNNNNLLLVHSDAPTEEDWFNNESAADIDEREDSEISKAVLTAVFNAMEADEKTKLLNAIFDQVKLETDAPELIA